MLGLFDRLVLTTSQRSTAMRPALPESRSEHIGDSFILDWSLDDAEAVPSAEDDAAIALANAPRSDRTQRSDRS